MYHMRICTSEGSVVKSIAVVFHVHVIFGENQSPERAY